MRTHVFALLAALALVGGARAQEAPPPPANAPLFPQLFPQPTGQNGLEDIVRAGDTIVDSKLLQPAAAPDATLTAKREALDERSTQQALKLLRQGFGKQVGPTAGLPMAPRMTLLGRLRMLSRALVVQQYVQLADGQVGDSIVTLRDALRLGYLAQSDTIVGSLTGIAVDTLAITGFAQHLSQLSARDCERLMALARERAAVTDPAVYALDGERRHVMAELDTQAPEAIRPQVKALFDADFDRMIANLREPAWRRKPLGEPVTDQSDASQFFLAMRKTSAPIYSRIEDIWTREVAQVSLLGTHAAILRYRWEYGRLPSSLEDLKAGPLAVDPFTGKALVYRPLPGGEYELYSEGPPERDKETGAPTGARVRINLPP